MALTLENYALILINLMLPNRRTPNSESGTISGGQHKRAMHQQWDGTLRLHGLWASWWHWPPQLGLAGVWVGQTTELWQTVLSKKDHLGALGGGHSYQVKWEGYMASCTSCLGSRKAMEACGPGNPPQYCYVVQSMPTISPPFPHWVSWVVPG